MGDEILLPDYGLDDLVHDNGLLETSADALNDDTFGAPLENLQEEFVLAGDPGGGFFGELGKGDDYLLEPDGLTSDPSMLEGALEDEDGDLQPDTDADFGLDAHLQRMMDFVQSPESKVHAPSLGRRGLRVTGLPPSLDEMQTRQLLSHFGPLSHFEMRKEGQSSVAMLSYQDESLTNTACSNLHGIPLGGRSCPKPRMHACLALRDSLTVPQSP
eukprot:115287-Pleurochrysis_carterae.AAC.2